MWPTIDFNPTVAHGGKQPHQIVGRGEFKRRMVQPERIARRGRGIIRQDVLAHLEDRKLVVRGIAADKGTRLHCNPMPQTDLFIFKIFGQSHSRIGALECDCSVHVADCLPDMSDFVTIGFMSSSVRYCGIAVLLSGDPSWGI